MKRDSVHFLEIIPAWLPPLHLQTHPSHDAIPSMRAIVLWPSVLFIIATLHSSHFSAPHPFRAAASRGPLFMSFWFPMISAICSSILHTMSMDFEAHFAAILSHVPFVCGPFCVCDGCCCAASMDTESQCGMTVT